VVIVEVNDQDRANELIKYFDKECFPKEMLLEDDGISHLFENGARVFEYRTEFSAVAVMILVPEAAVYEYELREADPEMEFDPNGMYCYSIAVLPFHRRKGIGQSLTRVGLDTARHEGFTSFSAHARISNHWHEGMATTNPQERRIVPNYWEEDGDVEFQRTHL